MIKLATVEGTNILGVEVTEKLTKEDYAQFVPKVEELIGLHGSIRILLEMNNFHGWEAGALWEDIKFDAKHFADMERIALVGDKKWEKGMAAFCKPFTTAEVRYFELSQLEDAKKWIVSGQEQETARIVI